MLELQWYVVCQAALWQKFMAICGVNGVTALTRLPMGEIAACEETRNLLKGTMEEVEAVARATGANLPEESVDQYNILVRHLF